MNPETTTEVPIENTPVENIPVENTPIENTEFPVTRPPAIESAVVETIMSEPRRAEIKYPEAPKVPEVPERSKISRTNPQTETNLPDYTSVPEETSAQPAINKPNVPNPKPVDQVIAEPVEIEPIEVSGEKIPLPSTRSIEEKVKALEPRITSEELETLKTEAENRLKKQYPDAKNIEVRVSDHERDIDKQFEYFFEKGSSKTPIGLHQFGAAADFQIYIDGNLVTADGSEGLTGSIDPYRVLGGAAKDAGLFWGWSWDSGHVGRTRFTTEALKQYPQLLQDPKIKEVYKSLLNKPTLDRSLEGLMDVLSKEYGSTYKGEWTGEPDTLETLLEPIRPK